MKAQDSLKKLSQWGEEVAQTRTDWPGNDAFPSGRPSVLSMTLDQLGRPVFPVDKEPKRVFTEREDKLWQEFKMLGSHPTSKEVDSLLKKIAESNILSDFPDADQFYFAQAQALSRISRFEESEAILENAFQKCLRRRGLCAALGDTKSFERDPICFGWFIQACLLGYEDFIPYLALANAAEVLRLKELSIRLLNASDIVARGMPRFSSTSTPFRAIALKDSQRLCNVLIEFLGFADFFLPPADILPTDNTERSMVTSLFKLDPIPARSKILNRSAA